MADTLSLPYPDTTSTGRVVASVADLVGDTPLFDLSRLTGSRVRLMAKAELTNPGGSVKDRPALSMIRAAESAGLLLPGRRLLDATSGNTGIALAMFGAALGYPVTLCLPENASAERKRLLAAYGAEVILTDPMDGSDGAIRKARRMADESPDRYVYLDQYSNPANPDAHYRATGPEIWAQTRGQVTHFVTGLGTSGTFMGVGRYFRDRAPHVHLTSMEPDGPLHGLEGMKHMASALVPAIYDDGLADESMEVSTEAALDRLRQLARDFGLLVGKSAAANVEAGLRVARDLDEGTVVTILCDGADRYLSEPFWDV